MIVVRHLQSRGVDPTRMRAISAGQYHPRAANDSAAGRARNRRTEIVLRPRQGREPGVSKRPYEMNRASEAR